MGRRQAVMLSAVEARALQAAKGRNDRGGVSEIKIGAGAWMGHGPCESERAFPTSRRPLLLSAGRSRHRQGISAKCACVPTTPTRRWLRSASGDPWSELVVAFIHSRPFPLYGCTRNCAHLLEPVRQVRVVPASVRLLRRWITLATVGTSRKCPGVPTARARVYADTKCLLCSVVLRYC